jgi:L-2,4-diaminobutyrate decarboxylase
MEVVHWLRENLGYSVPSSYSKSREIGGILTLGGCLSNTIALLAAREKLFPGCGLNGLPVLPGTVRILVPDIIEHYSIRSGMSWLGMGEKNVVRVPVDDRYCIDQGALEQVIAHEREMGHNILACVAYAGDSRSMRIDKLDSLAEILGKHNIWFHVDACHGSQLAFSERHKHALRGIERADSITIDPHKVLCIPYTCSFVLFKDPTTLANTATSSDLILNTQWSLGQITPFIGSKAFDALKLWATIKVLGKQRIGKLVDERLDLTLAIQTAIRQRRNLILLNETDINSCMFIFIPYQLRRHCLQKSVKISDADLEKLNMVNRQIKEAIRLEGSSYVHGFTLKSCSHELIQPNRILYTMRTMNGNPLSTLQHVHALLDKIEQLGEQYLSKANYKFVDHDDPSNPFRRVHQKLDSQLHILFAGQEYVAVIYGSSAYDDMKLMSDIDLMVFAPESLSSSKATCTALETLFCSIMAEEGIIVDAEVPFNRKLLVSIPFATNAATGASIHVNGDGRICSVQKTPEYLASDEMIQRLVFNVLTTPVKIISGSTEVSKTFLSLSRVASYNLVELLGRINPGQFEISSCNPQDMANFIKLAIMDGCRSGEDYLGYKDRSAVKLKLNKVFLDFCKNKEK